VRDLNSEITLNDAKASAGSKMDWIGQKSPSALIRLASFQWRSDRFEMPSLAV
jgi:hypothetical protein